MNFTIDDALRKRLAGIRELGRTQIRPLGIEADRAGKPVDRRSSLLRAAPEARPRPHALARAERTTAATNEARTPKPRRRGPSRDRCPASPKRWRTGIAASRCRFPGRGSASRPCCRWERRSRRSASSRRFREPDRPRWGSFAMTEPGAGSDVSSIRTSCDARTASTGCSTGVNATSPTAGRGDLDGDLRDGGPGAWGARGTAPSWWRRGRPASRSARSRRRWACAPTRRRS